jgi:hypothetical protein
MADNVFTFGGVTPMVWDFTFAMPANNDIDKTDSTLAHRSTKSTAISHEDAETQRAKLIQDISKKLPVELQMNIWTELMEKPGLHFFALYFPDEDRVARRDVDQFGAGGIPHMMLAEPKALQDSDIFDEPFVSYFPLGVQSAYERWAKLAMHDPSGDSQAIAEAVVKRSFIKPLSITYSLASGPTKIDIDAATDVVYLKFYYEYRGNSTYYVPWPCWWMLVYDKSLLKGIRHIAIELDPVDFCIFWPCPDDVDMCAACNYHVSYHEKSESSRLWMLADFLHCLEDLEVVYCVFNEAQQGPADTNIDGIYTVSGMPLVDGTEDSDRWKHGQGKNLSLIMSPL